MYASDLKHKSSSLEDKLHQLYALKSGGSAIEPGFRPVYTGLLSALGNPHRALPPVIHVAGTNGKGSIIAFLRSIFECAGYRVHAYTSPHLLRFNERIVLAGSPVDDVVLEDLIDEILLHNKNRPATFFELTTALAFAAFARTPADILLLETGLGGRLDCTNIIESPALTIISTIGRDHTEFLGETIAEIAAEKAGIMKQDIPCIIGAQSESTALPVFETQARSKNAALFRHGREWNVQMTDQGFIFRFENESYALPSPSLPGPHQILNAGAALAAIHALHPRFSVDSDHIETGLRETIWPARLQNITPQNFPTGWEIWLDGGHNESAAQILAAQAANWNDRPLHLILGMMCHKDPAAFLHRLAPYIDSLHTVSIPGEPAAFTAGDLQNMLRPQAATAHPNLKTAMDAIAQNAAPGRILITGSLYLAGHTLDHLGQASP